jgi:hypothetical protein
MFDAPILLIIIAFLMKMSPEHQGRDVITVIGLATVLFGAIAPVRVVDTTGTLTAPMGIPGATASYLFGRLKIKKKSVRFTDSAAVSTAHCRG